MANTATHQLPPGDCVDKGFDPSPLPHRPVQWRRAADAMRRLHQGYDNGAALDYASALEGDDGERYFQAFLAEPGAADLLREQGLTVVPIAVRDIFVHHGSVRCLVNRR